MIKNNKKSIYTILGIMTGTSMDGIDFSLIRTNGINYVKIIKEKSYNFSSKNQNDLKEIIDNKPKNINKLKDYFFKNDYKFNKLLVYFIRKFFNDFKIKNNTIDFISLSGQTVFHNPIKNLSIQLGSGQIIANEFKIKTISDLRENDIKHNGQGAPIGAYYHKYLINKLKKKSIIINIGGIANFTAIKSKNIFSSDIGPGNSIIDDLSYYYFKKKFDKNGFLSSKGKPIKKILGSFKKDDFFKKKFPKSLDRNYFDKYKKKLLKEDKYNALSTATYMILISFQKFMDKKEFSFDQIILTGGGRKNKYLLKILKKYLKINIELIDDSKINGDLVESQMFAYIGIRSHKKLIISNKFTTGVAKGISGGKLYLPN